MTGEAAYPTRALRYVVPFGGGPTDAQARWLAPQLSAALGQPVVVENHPGASGAAGTALVARAAPDGYTLLAANPGPLTVGPHLRTGNAYDPLRSFAPVILMATVTSVLAVNPRAFVASIGELIALAQGRSNLVRYGSPGIGTVGHLAMELFMHCSGAPMEHVPCEGLEEAVPRLVAGDFDALIIPLPDAFPLAREGRIRALAATRRSRSALWPELPSIEEAGLAGFESFNWNGVAAPAGTPRPVVERLNLEIDRVLNSPPGRAFFEGKGYEVVGGSPEAFEAFIRTEHEKWRGVAATARIAID